MSGDFVEKEHDKKKHGAKENLNWKINYLAAQAGEKTHLKTAIIAASRAKHHKIHSKQTEDLDPETVRQQLQAARKLKLETKLYHARKDLKSALKKARTTEIMKQIKKIKSTRKALEDKEEAEAKTSKKVLTDDDLEQYEKELDILKNIELESLVDRTLCKKLQKHPELKNDELIKETILPSLNMKKSDDLTVQNLESRLLANKAISAEVTENINGFYNIIKGNLEKIELRKQEAQKRKEAEETKKRKNEEREQQQRVKRTKTDASSEFVESLGGGSKGGFKYDETQDEFFQKIYEGKKKTNRPGQRQRRKQWEELYGKEAKHVQSEYQKREEKRRAKPDYKPPKKKQTPAAKPKPAVKSSAPAGPPGPVHPSWEAKKMQEEMMSKALSGQGPKNNKIVFDDD